MHYSVLGAGPAGLSAAIVLSNAGNKTIVYESSPLIGGRSGTNIQAMRNYGSDKDIIKKIESYGIKMPKLNSITKIIKYSPTYRTDEIYSEDEPIFYTFKRGPSPDSMESSFAEQAKNKGAQIILGKAAKVIDCQIIASGSKFDPVGFGYGATFEGTFDKDTIAFFYGNELIQNGYAYITPYGKDMLSVAITSFTKQDFGTISERFEKFIKTDKIIKETINGAKRLNSFAGYGHFNVPETAFHKYKYFTGGSAGFVDPARGFGVKYAILSGAMAAKALIDKKINYDEVWKKEFKQELLEGFNRRILLNKLTTQEYEKFVKGEKLNIKDYEKVPNAIKEIFMQINGKVHIRNWQKKFDLDKLIE
ncbi:MAG: NAD(P)/FAD-dependent oxidoreductase [Sphaerochaetaceae bacterium]|nr:NAD(P)/FAD-dependent oxidoreductase [Sphaerochaetaceae bacterium]